MRSKLTLLLSFTIMTTFLSCSPNRVSFLCNSSDYSIYVDGEEIGKGLVHYMVPKGTKVVEVSLRKNGVTKHTKYIDVKQYKGKLVDIAVPDDNRYSSDNQFHSR